MGAYASEVKRLGEQAQSAAQLAPLTVSNNNHHHSVSNYLKKKNYNFLKSSDSLGLP